MHDFKSLSDNFYYTDYIELELANLGIKNRIPVSHVEDRLLEKNGLLLNDKSDFVDYRHKKHVSARSSYLTKVADFNDEVFKTWLGTIILMNTNTIDFVTDTTLMSYDTGCSIRVATTSHHARRGRFITNGSTVYDRGNRVSAAEDRPNCVVMKKDDTIILRKSEGNLFELDMLAVTGEHFIYGFREHPRVVVKLDEYVERESDDLFKLPLYKAVLNYLKERKTNVLGNLLNVLQARYNIPDTFMALVKNRNESVRISLARMLFDFKRAGDHLQVKSCNRNGRVFISNDRMSTLLAALINVPTVRTTKDPDHTRVLHIYNLNLVDDKQFEELLIQNMRDSLKTLVRQTNAFGAQVAAIQPALQPYKTIIQNMIIRTTRLLSLGIVRANERGAERRRQTTAQTVFEYECYYQWAAVHYLLTYAMMVTQLPAEGLMKPNVFNVDVTTRDELTKELNTANVMKFHEAIDPSAITNPSELLRDIERAHSQPDPIKALFDAAFVQPKPYVKLIVGVEDMLTLFQKVWTTHHADVLLGADKTPLRTRIVAVTPKVASYLDKVHKSFNTIMSNLIMGFNQTRIPKKFKESPAVMIVNPEAVTQPDAPILSTEHRKRARTQLGGAPGATAARDTVSMRGHVGALPATAARTHAHVMPHHHVETAKKHDATAAKGPRSHRPSGPAAANKVIVPITAFQEQEWQDHKLIQVIIAFFLQTDLALTEYIVNAEIY